MKNFKIEYCNTCDGAGVIAKDNFNPFDFDFDDYEICQNCNGLGAVIKQSLIKELAEFETRIEAENILMETITI